MKAAILYFICAYGPFIGIALTETLLILWVRGATARDVDQVPEKPERIPAPGERFENSIEWQDHKREVPERPMDWLEIERWQR